MNKEEAVAALSVVVKSKWEDAKKAFDTSRAGATSDQSKQEGKYDTRSVEEAYLAHGLANAVVEYEKALADLENCRQLEATPEVSVGSLICCKRDGEGVSFLLSHSGGGIEAEVNGEEVIIITPESPLAKKLLSKAAGERAGAFVVKGIL